MNEICRCGTINNNWSQKQSSKIEDSERAMQKWVVFFLTLLKLER